MSQKTRDSRRKLHAWGQDRAMEEARRQQRAEIYAGIWDGLRIVGYLLFGCAVAAGLVVIAMSALSLFTEEDYPAQRVASHLGTVECRTESPTGELVKPWRDPCSPLRSFSLSLR